MIEIIKLLRRLFKGGCLVLSDLAAFYLTLCAAVFIRTAVLPYFLSDLPPFYFSYAYFLTLWWIPAIFIFFILYEGLYEKNLTFWDEVRIMLKAVSLATVTVMAIVTLGKMQDKVSRVVLIGAWALSLFTFPLSRLWGKKLLYALNVWRERILILGAGNAGRLVMEGLGREKHMGFDVIGFLDDDEEKKGIIIDGKKVFGKVRHFPRFVNDLNIETVVIAMPSLPADKLSALTAGVQNYATNTMVIPDLKGIALINTELLHLFYEELFLMNIQNNLKSLPNKMIKRLFDICVSLLSLPLVLPAIGIFGLLIRLETPGNSIYSHNRMGRNGKAFKCYKFRTMERNAEEKLREMLESSEEIRCEWEKNRKLKEDPRITKVGRFLRKTSLDELPQIFNVIKGDMSLVGPRPVTREEIEKHYGEAAGLCFSVPPGITGLWQVSGRSSKGYDYRMKLDAWYVMNWSIWLDVTIIFKTLRVVTKMEGAY